MLSERPGSSLWEVVRGVHMEAIAVAMPDKIAKTVKAHTHSKHWIMNRCNGELDLRQSQG